MVLASVRIEDDHPLISVSIRDEDFIRLGVHVDISRSVECPGLLVCLDETGLADLHHELSFFRELQDLVVFAAATDPDVPLVIDENAVFYLGQSNPEPGPPQPPR